MSNTQNVNPDTNNDRAKLAVLIAKARALGVTEFRVFGDDGDQINESQIDAEILNAMTAVDISTVQLCIETPESASHCIGAFQIVLSSEGDDCGPIADYTDNSLCRQIEVAVAEVRS